MKSIITLLSLSLLLSGCVNNNPKQNQNYTDAPISPEMKAAQQEELVYIKNIVTKNNKTYIDVDQIEWLSSTDDTCSTTPEVKAGMPQCNPNGFLIQNESLNVVSYEVSPQVNIKTTKSGENPLADSDINLQEFNEYFTSQKEYFSLTPFYIQTEGGVITKIQEKYIP